MRETAERNAAEVQCSGSDDKTHGIGDGVRPMGNSAPCAWPWKMAKAPTSMAATQSGGFTANATIAPSMMAETAIPVSTPGRGIPTTPRAPPKAITSGNTTGRSQIAGAPRNAPHSPTATIAMTWSGPKIGCVKPPQKSMATPCSECAKTGLAIDNKANAIKHRSHRFLRVFVIDVNPPINLINPPINLIVSLLNRS